MDSNNDVSAVNAGTAAETGMGMLKSDWVVRRKLLTPCIIRVNSVEPSLLFLNKQPRRKSALEIDFSLWSANFIINFSPF